MENVKIIVGSSCNEDWQLIGRSGKDITEELGVTKCVVTVEPGESTKAQLTVYAEVEASTEDVTIITEPTTFVPDKEAYKELEKLNDEMRAELVTLRKYHREAEAMQGRL